MDIQADVEAEPAVGAMNYKALFKRAKPLSRYRKRRPRDEALPVKEQRQNVRRSPESYMFELTKLINLDYTHGLHIYISRNWVKMYGLCNTLCRGTAFNTDAHKKWQKDLILGCQMFASDCGTLEKMTVVSCLQRALAMKFYEIRDMTNEIEASGRTLSMHDQCLGGNELLASSKPPKPVHQNLFKSI